MNLARKRTNIDDIVAKLFSEVSVAAISFVLIVLGVTSPVFSFFAFALNVVYILLSTSEKIFYQMFFLIAFANVFKLSPGSTSLFTYLELLAVFKIFLNDKKINKIFFVSFLIFFSYILFGYNGNYTVLIKQAMIPLVVYGFCTSSKCDFKKITYFFLFGLLISSLLALNTNLVPNLSQYITYDKVYDADLGDVDRFSGMYSDPNYYSLSLILALICVLLMYIYKQLGVAKCVIYISAIAFFGSQTISKSFLLMLAVVVIIFIVLLFKNKKYALGILLTLIIPVIVLLVISGSIPIFQGTIQRLSEGSDLTTGRSAIWEQYLSYFKNNFVSLIFGSGVAAGYLRSAAHNTYIDFLYYYGVCGTIIFVATCAFAIRKKFRRAIANYFPLMCIAIMAMFLSSLMHFDFAFILALTLYILNFDFKKDFYDKGLEIK